MPNPTKCVMTEEMYLAPGGRGNESVTSYPYCALGKINQCLDEKLGTISFYNWFRTTIGNDNACVSVFQINDGIHGHEANHYKALKLAIQMLQEKGFPVKLPEVAFKEEPALVV